MADLRTERRQGIDGLPARTPERDTDGWMSNMAPPDLAAFEDERGRLLGLAYRITGSRADADDIVQEAWLRWSATDSGAIENPAAWLTTVTSRIALDRLKSAQHRRERYVGPWLPEVTATVGDEPGAHAELAESVTMGFLTVLERLNPIERAVFVLADVFDVPFGEIAGVVDKSPAACRQIASRARRRVREERPRFAATEPSSWETAEAFAAALTNGDTDEVLRLLAPDVVLVSDGGSEHHAARRPVAGADRVNRFLANLTRRAIEQGATFEPKQLNGQPGVIVRDADGDIWVATVISVVHDQVDRVWTVVNPDKFQRIDAYPIS